MAYSRLFLGNNALPVTSFVRELIPMYRTYLKIAKGTKNAKDFYNL